MPSGRRLLEKQMEVFSFERFHFQDSDPARRRSPDPPDLEDIRTGMDSSLGVHPPVTIFVTACTF